MSENRISRHSMVISNKSMNWYFQTLVFHFYMTRKYNVDEGLPDVIQAKTRPENAYNEMALFLLGEGELLSNEIVL